MRNGRKIDRRDFLNGVGTVAVASALGTSPSAATANPERLSVQQQSNRYDFDAVYSRLGTNSSKWDHQISLYGREHVQVGMGTADQDFRSAPAITRALRERVQHENYGYLTVPNSYIESIVNWNQRRYNLEIDPETLRHSAGVHPAIISTLRAFCPPRSKVLVLTPSYNGFYTDIRIVDTVAEESPLQLVNGRYRIDFDDFEKRIDHDVHAFILCNPQNPTGNVWSRQDLTRLGEICTRRRVVVLADEIHCDFVTAGNTYTPYATLDDDEIVRNSITYKSVSKSFNLSAMRCSYMFSTNREYLERISGPGQLQQEMSTLALVAAEAAYNEGEEWLDQLVEYIDGTQSFVESFVREQVPFVNVIKPEGTYLSWLDVGEALNKTGSTASAASDESMTPEDVFQHYLVEHANIHINPGSNYGFGGASRMRMNIATSRQLVELALNNMANALQRA